MIDEVEFLEPVIWIMDGSDPFNKLNRTTFVTGNVSYK